MTPEGKVKREVKKRLRKDAWYYMPVQNGMGRSGIPDFIGCVPTVITQEMVGQTVGVFFAIETKAPGKLGNTTSNQDRELSNIHAAGGIATVLDDPAMTPKVLTCQQPK